MNQNADSSKPNDSLARGLQAQHRIQRACTHLRMALTTLDPEPKSALDRALFEALQKADEARVLLVPHIEALREAG